MSTGTLRTRWSDAAATGETLHEYPRPQLQRDSYLSLNGTWQYEITRGEETVCSGDILVPFAPESPLSGVNHILQPDELLHYHAKFDLPEGFCKGRVLLHFGAVDQVCQVWVNDQEVGAHAGGYTAFTMDITDALQGGENTLSVQVQDQTEHAPYGRGKQRLQTGSGYATLFYTPVSGIWKSVWIESVPDRYIEGLRITPRYDSAEVAVEIEVAGDADPAATGVIEISLEGRMIARQEIDAAHPETIIPMPDFHAWTPDEPTLYDVQITYGYDTVRSYFGMRKIHIGKDRHGILRFYLNDEPIFMNGMLDQGYWPDGIMTAPSDEAYIHDIQTLKDLGYNLIRKHIKVEAERFYYHCDRLGMLVWQDMPNGGGIYNMNRVTTLPNILPWFQRHMNDHQYDKFARESEEGRQAYYQELREMVGELYNHPSIVAWVPFNEGWGQFDAAEATARIRQMDETRLVDEACGWFDQGGGDMYTVHNYWRRLHVWPQPKRVVALTEYGGYALQVPDHMLRERGSGYKGYHTPEELTEAYVLLIRQDVLTNMHRGLSAAIYTQISDVEEECNGLMTYDREVCKMDAEQIREINRKVYERYAKLVR